MEGTTFGDVPLKAEVKLEVWDNANSAGVVIDAIRCSRSPSTAAPPVRSKARRRTHEVAANAVRRQYADDAAHDIVEEFIAG